MLLKELITELLEVYLQEVKKSKGQEPEILIDLFRQTDSAGNFQYCGVSKDIHIQESSKSKKLVISAIDDEDTHTSGFGFLQEVPETENTKLDVKTEIAFLVDFPRVKEKIEATWGTLAGRQYLYGLILDDRPGRQNSKVKGFPPNIYAVLINLLALHDEAYPYYVPAVKTWDINNCF